MKMDSGECEENVNFNVMCRTCALPFDSVVLRDITPHIREMLQFCVDIEVNPLSDLPTHICGTCYKRADDASQFKLQCQRSEQRIREICARMVMRATSTPSQNSPQTTQPSSPRTPLSVASDMETRLTPSGCDAAIAEILEHDEVPAPNLDTTSISNFLDVLLQQNTDNKSQESGGKSPSPERSINPDSVLSFLDRDGACEIENLDDSFSLITNFGVSPLKQEATDNVAVTAFYNNEPDSELDEPNVGTKGTSKEKMQPELQPTTEESDIQSDNDMNISFIINQNFETEQLFDGNVESLHENEQLGNTNNEFLLDLMDNNNKGKQFRNPQIVPNIMVHDYKCLKRIRVEFEMEFIDKPVNVTVVDFIKRPMPVKLIHEEFQILGYVRCRFCYHCITKVQHTSIVRTVHEHLAINHADECIKCREPDYVKLCRPEIHLRKSLMSKGCKRCRYCILCFTDTGEFYRHLRSKHYEICRDLIVYRKINKGPFCCDYCNKKFSKKFYLRKHIERHNSMGVEKKHERQCKICKHFVSITAYKNHKLSHNIAKKHLCTDCGEKFTTLFNLKAHAVRHGKNEREISCLECEKKYKFKKDLTRHIRTHVKQHTCTVCSKTFSRLDHFKRHVYLVHSRKKCNIVPQ